MQHALQSSPCHRRAAKAICDSLYVLRSAYSILAQSNVMHVGNPEWAVACDNAGVNITRKEKSTH